MEDFLKEWDEAEAEAVALLREALPEIRDMPPPPGLAAAAADLRRRLGSRDFDLRPVLRANGWSRGLPPDDRQLWIEAAGGLIAMENPTGLAAEQESLLAALEHADWLGAVLGMVRGGAGTPVTPRQLVSYIDSCPEIEGEINEDDSELIEAAFELILPTWQAAGALDAGMCVTEVGRWGLPRALAWAWDGDFDAPSETDD
jgi:hypothetical protein